MKHVTLAYAVAVLALAGSAAAQETPQTGAPAEWAGSMLDPQVFTFVQAERLEGRTSGGEKGYLLDLQGWVGTDTSKFWGKAEGVIGEQVEGVEVQALYSRMISPFFDLQLGVRQDIASDVSRTHVVIGVQGLAPYWFEVEAAAFISHTGDVTARLETEYELLFTQRLVLQPRIALDFAFQEVEALGLGAGLSSAEADLRLRYEIRREFAPYIGVSWWKVVGGTVDGPRSAGQRPSEMSLLAGVRMWY